MIKEIFSQRFGIYDLDVPDDLNKKLVDLAYSINAESFHLHHHYSQSKESKDPHKSGFADNPYSYIGAHLGLLNRTHYFKSFPKEFISEFIDPIIKRYLDETQYVKPTFPDLIPYIDRCWFTLMSTGDAIKPHNHDVAGSLGIAYYPDDMDQKGDFQIYSYKIDKDIFSHECNVRAEIIKPKKSRLLIFPSHVYHGTSENLSNNPRISYSMDVNFIGLETFMPPPELILKVFNSYKKQLDFIGEA